VFVIPGVVVLVFRIRDEETLLTRELAGYREYARHVRFRLLPYIW
jgi:protein-S-isoprenylcysteine O-methyltransferase Ste14